MEGKLGSCLLEIASKLSKMNITGEYKKEYRIESQSLKHSLQLQQIYFIKIKRHPRLNWFHLLFQRFTSRPQTDDKLT